MKKIITVLAVTVCLLLCGAAAANAQDTTGIPMISTKRMAAVSVFGAAFPTSPDSTGLNTGFTKRLLVLYEVSQNFALSFGYGGTDFNATSVGGETDLEQYSLSGIYHEKVYKQLGIFAKFALLSHKFDGAEASGYQVGHLEGAGMYIDLPGRLDPLFAFDYQTVNQEMRISTFNLWGGLAYGFGKN